MAAPKFLDQKRKLEELLKLTHLSPDEVAERVGIKADTFRKYLNGYQPCGWQTMNRIGDVIRFELERQDKIAAKMPGEKVHEEAIHYGNELLKLPPDKQSLVKNLINQFSGKVDKVAEEAGRRAVESVETHEVVYGRRKRRANSDASKAAGIFDQLGKHGDEVERKHAAVTTGPPSLAPAKSSNKSQATTAPPAAKTSSTKKT